MRTVLVVGCCLVLCSCSSAAIKSGLQTIDSTAHPRTPIRASIAKTWNAAAKRAGSGSQHETPDCAAGQLHLSIADQLAGAGSQTLLIAAHNSAGRCRLVGYPTLTLRGCRSDRRMPCATGHILHRLRSIHGDTSYPDPGAHAVVLGRHRAAEFAVGASAAGYDGSPDFISRLTVDLTDGGKVGLDLTFACSGPKHAPYYKVTETAWALRLRLPPYLRH